jgi:hypothetical protein
LASGAVVWLALFSSCGGAGDGGGGDDEPEDEGGGGVVDDEVKDVSGHFYLGDTETPAAGYEIWIVDHDAPELMRHPLDKRGKFVAQLTAFTEGHVYSFHLVSRYVLVADIDLSSANAGTQAAFTYEGGYGFDLGDVVVPLDGRGMVDLSAGDPLGTVGGGFALRTAEDARFGSFPAPADFPTVAVGSRLLVFDASTALHSFYRRAENPTLYARDLAALSRLAVRVVPKDGKTVGRAYVAEAGAWLTSARVPASTDPETVEAPLWSEQDFALTPAKHATDGAFEASVLTGALPTAGSIAIIKATPEDGKQSVVPRALETVLAVPPLVLAAAADGGAPVAIDYTGDGENGLTRPLCQTGEVSLTLASPLDVAGELLALAEGATITVEFAYYQLKAGRTVPIAVPAKTYASIWKANFDGSDAGDDMTMSWRAAPHVLTLTLGATAAAASSHTLTLAPSLFPATVGDQEIVGARLKITYAHPTSAAAAGVVFWLAKGC